MKKLLLLISIFIGGVSVQAQVIFNDDFEAYEADKFLGPQSSQWTTWSKADGGADDTKVSNVRAASGTKSIYFKSTAATGGPADVVLPFSNKYTNGAFKMGMKLYIPTGKGAYFNLQAEKAVGTTWAMDAYMTPDGDLRLSGSGAFFAGTTFPADEWFLLEIEGNISGNLWKAKLNGKDFGSFKLASNAVASIDFYPDNANSEFFVDDFYYSHEPFVPKANDIALTGISLPTFELAGLNTPITASVVNLGASIINDLNITVNYAGNTYTKNATGLNLASFKTAEIVFDNPVAIAPGTNELMVTTVINNVTDDDITNNNFALQSVGVVPAPNKLILVEEGTGTWCGWCPRGAVGLAGMEARYHDYFAGVAVHNGDPMTVAEYDDGLDISGFPDSKVNRKPDLDPSYSNLKAEFFNMITESGKAIVRSGATIDNTTREIKIQAQFAFTEAINTQHTAFIAVTEDEVKGTAAKYAQANYYANNARGPMGGFEALPDPVPATQMVYDHVARMLIGGINGTALPQASYAAGDKATLTFTATVPAEVNLEHVHIIPVLLNEVGLVVNAGKLTFSEVLASGLSDVEDVITDGNVVVFPNPFSQTTVVDMEIIKNSQVSAKVYDMSGKTVYAKDFGNMSGQVQLPIEVGQLPAGQYTLNIQVDSEIISKSIQIQK